MRFNIVSAFAALALLTACASDPQTDSSAETTGGETTTATSTAPAPAPAATAAPSGPVDGSVPWWIANVGDRVFFDLNSSEIRADQVATLERQAAFLQRFPAITLVVEGHADERGTREYNLALGERRANSHKDYLISLGVSAARIETVSYGKESPAVLGSNEAAWAQNRRGVAVLKNAPSS